LTTGRDAYYGRFFVFGACPCLHTRLRAGSGWRHSLCTRATALCGYKSSDNAFIPHAYIPLPARNATARPPSKGKRFVAATGYAWNVSCSTFCSCCLSTTPGPTKSEVTELVELYLCFTATHPKKCLLYRLVYFNVLAIFDAVSPASAGISLI